MKKRCVLLLLVLVLAGLVTTRAAARPTPAPGPRTVGEGTYTVSGLAGNYDLVNRLWEFPAGSWTPLHTHPGRTLLVVLAGEFTLREKGKESRYPAGTFWTETPGIEHAAGNQGTNTALVSAAYLLPKDAPLSTPVPGTATPPIAGKPLFTSKVSLSGLSGDYDFTERVLDFAPGVWTPLHTHPGPVLLTVLEGTFTLREEGKERTYAAGTFWQETPGHVHMAGNRGTTNARVSAVYLVPKGAPLATTVQGPAGGLPATGENAAPAVLGLLVAVGLSLVVCGRLVRHVVRGAS